MLSFRPDTKVLQIHLPHRLTNAGRQLDNEQRATIDNTMDNDFRFSKKVGTFLTKLFETFNLEKLCYCVLHSYEGLPAYTNSDVDMAVASGDLKKCEEIIFDVSDLLGFRVIQKLYYDIPRCYYYVVFFRDDDGAPGFVQLDVLNDDHGIGRYILKTKTILEGRQRFNGFYIPSAPVEACYLLIKRTIKGQVLPEHADKLSRLFQEGGKAVDNFVASCFGVEHMGEILRLVEGMESSDQRDVILSLRKALLFRYRTLAPHLRILALLWFIKRVWERMVFPTGLIAILISPDGGGKSTVADLLLQRLRFGFRNAKRIHWRPYLLPPPNKLFSPERWKEPEAPNHEPHKSAPKGIINSIARFFYYLTDFVLGYFPKVLWLKMRTHLVVFERYYYDFLIDTKRFRFTIPSWLPYLFLPFVPKGDILLVLSGSAEVLYKRKQEIPLHEIRRQLDAIERLSKRLDNVCRVNVDQPIMDEVLQIESAIVETLEERLRDRTGHRRHE